MTKKTHFINSFSGFRYVCVAALVRVFMVNVELCHHGINEVLINQCTRFRKYRIISLRTESIEPDIDPRHGSTGYRRTAVPLISPTNTSV